MTLHKKTHIESKKEAAAKKLALRLETLKAQNLDERAIRKDPTVRQIKAAIRQAKHQMERIAEIEALDRKKAEAREQKRNAPREVRPKAKKSVQGESHRMAKREKKRALQGQEGSEE